MIRSKGKALALLTVIGFVTLGLLEPSHSQDIPIRRILKRGASGPTNSPGGEQG